MTLPTSIDAIVDPPYRGAERRRRKPVLDLRLCDVDADAVAHRLLTTRRTAAEGVGTCVTPNIQHVALARRDPAFAEAMQKAQIVIADGFPVYRFARARGLTLPGRVTGREVIERMFADPAALAGHRGYFVVDSEESAAALTAWLADFAPGMVVATHVPPFGFETDAEQCCRLADTIRAFDATLLFLCVGAPKSEVFAYRYRALLPPCWALCVGQSFRLLLGAIPSPPAAMVRLNLEWLWRVMLEPRRMLARYGPSAWGFARAALADVRKPK